MIVSYHCCRYILGRLDEPGFSISGGAALHRADSLRLEKGSQHFWVVCACGDVQLGSTPHWRYAICTPCLPAVGVSLFFGSFHVSEDWFRADRKREYPLSAIG